MMADLKSAQSEYNLCKLSSYSVAQQKTIKVWKIPFECITSKIVGVNRTQSSN